MSEFLLAAEILVMLIGASIALFFLFSTVSFLFGAPFVSSGRGVAGAALKLAKLKKGERFCDLGSGDGRVVFAAASLGAEAVGIEINPLLWIWSIFLAAVRRSSARFILQNFFNADLQDADVVFIYTWQGTTERLEAKLKRELTKGARVVLHRFSFTGWKPASSDGERRLLMYVKK